MKHLLRKYRPSKVYHSVHTTFVNWVVHMPLYDENHIRLIVLHPGKWDDPITCDLKCADLSDPNLDYDAVSYAWGDASNRREIMCNSFHLEITQSLYEALQHLRQDVSSGDMWETRILWADAVCINQHDVKEREQQVLMMGTIYQRARYQLIWLGSNENESEVVNALDYVCRHAVREVREKRNAVCYVYDTQVRPYYIEQRHQVAVSMSSATAHALRQLFSCAVFQRGWVTQEVALSASATIYWGSGSIDLVWLLATAEYLFTYWKYIFENNVDAITGLNSFNSMRLILEDRSECQHTFLDLLDRSRGFKFTDTRDRVYALLGIQAADRFRIPGDSNDLWPFVKPDYTKGKLGCYQSVAEEYLINRQETQILSAIQHNGTIDENWPSWVPDWDIRSTPRDLKSVERLTAGHKLNIENPTSSIVSHGLLHDRPCISLRGIIIDSISKVLRCTANRSAKSVLIDFHLQAMPHSRDQVRLAWTATGGFHFDTGRSLNPARDRDHQLEGYLQFIRQRQPRVEGYGVLPPNSDLRAKHEVSIFDNSSPADRFAARFAEVMKGRCFFQTQTRRLVGIATNVMQEGDVVAVIGGCNVPLVLRPVELGTTAVFRVVGECYVYEIMEGEEVGWYDMTGIKPGGILVM